MKIDMSLSGLEKLKKAIEQLKADTPQVMTQIASQEAGMAVGYIKKETPVDTGNLRDSWHSKKAKMSGNTAVSTIYNNAEYASWVEYGHRKVNRKGKIVGWVNGQHFAEKTLRFYRDEVMEERIRKAVEKAIKKRLEE